MAQLAFPPGFRVTDTNDDPVASAKLYFYDAGTTDDRTVYQDDALSTPHEQPVVCGSDGLVPAIYVPTGTYRVVGKTSAGVAISGFDYDDISGPIDTAALTTTEAEPLTEINAKTATETISATLIGEMINANPTGGTFTLTLPAATAGNGKNLKIKHSGTANSVIVDGGASTIDGLNSVVLTNPRDALTFVSDGADWHIDTAPPAVPLPQGYASLASGTPRITSDLSAQGTIYYAFDKGCHVPIKYDGALYAVRLLSEPTLVLDSTGHTSGSIYDIGFILSNGAPVFCTSPAWDTLTPGSSARGTGSSTPELTRFNGVLVNANAFTARSNSTDYSVAAGEFTYIGTIVCSANGQVTCTPAYGQNRKWGVWNQYNQRQIVMKMGDATASWTMAASTSTRQSNSASGNTVAALVGEAGTAIEIDFRQDFNHSSGTSIGECLPGVGVNSTSTASGFRGTVTLNSSTDPNRMATARHVIHDGLGLNNLNALESNSGGGGVDVTGTEAGMQFVVRYMG